VKDRTKDFEALEAAFLEDSDSFTPTGYTNDVRPVEELLAKPSWSKDAQLKRACATPFFGHCLLLAAAQLTSDPIAYRSRAIALAKRAMTKLPAGRYATPWWSEARHYIALIALCQWQAVVELTDTPPESAEVSVVHSLSRLLAKLRLHGYAESHLNPGEWEAIDPEGHLRRVLALSHIGFVQPVRQSLEIIYAIDIDQSSPMAELYYEATSNGPRRPLSADYGVFAMMCTTLGTFGEEGEEEQESFHSFAQNRVTEAIVSTNAFFYTVMREVAEQIGEEDDADDDVQVDRSGLSPQTLVDLERLAESTGIDLNAMIEQIVEQVDSTEGKQCNCPSCTAKRQSMADAQSAPEPGGARSKTSARSKGSKPSGRIWRPSS
jgi:hypothetical protein